MQLKRILKIWTEHHAMNLLITTMIQALEMNQMKWQLKRILKPWAEYQSNLRMKAVVMKVEAAL